MKLVRINSKWKVEGDGTGWIFKKSFPTKWQAELAMKVFQKGGPVSDYWKEKKNHRKRVMDAWKVRARVQEVLEEIIALDPTPQEIEEFAEDAPYGVATVSDRDEYFGPWLHDTWGEKRGGRVHIDIGSGGDHLMLDKHSAPDFVAFIKNKRKKVLDAD